MKKYNIGDTVYFINDIPIYGLFAQGDAKIINKKIINKSDVIYTLEVDVYENNEFSSKKEIELLDTYFTYEKYEDVDDDTWLTDVDFWMDEMIYDDEEVYDEY